MRRTSNRAWSSSGAPWARAPASTRSLSRQRERRLGTQVARIDAAAQAWAAM
jgi:hypothetical protein